MQKITDIYSQYTLMPTLGMHQLRVAAVAKMICEHMTIPVDTENIVRACLLHDMGNIIKFIIGSIPESVEPEGLDYWMRVQSDFIKKYGPNEHHATLQIIQELGQEHIVYELVNCIGFHTAQENFLVDDFARKICAYADMRVTPTGVESLQGRLDNLRERYAGPRRTVNLDYDHEHDQKEIIEDHRAVFESSLKGIEKQIFEKCTIAADDITDESVKSMVEELHAFEL